VSAGLAAGAAGVAIGLFRRHGSGTAAPAKVADRLDPGQAVAFRYPGEDDRALAIRLPLPDGRLVGWSAVCTHLACAVLWREEDNHLECPCHDGVFDPVTGEVVAGPPPRPLPAVRLREDATGIWAVGTD
jgi:Rieske Fe-S protein